MNELEFTGERVVPGKVDQSLWHESMSRYIFASHFVDHKKVLDAGCGSGYGDAHFVSKGALSVDAIDISHQGIAYAYRNFYDSKINFRVMDITRLGYKAGSFDIVVSFEVIEHILGQDEFLSEVARVLKPDGIAIISTPNKGVYRSGLPPNPFHVHELTLQDYKVLLGKYFSQTIILSQSFFSGIEFTVLDRDQNQPTTSHIDRSSFPDKAPPSYLIAICSQSQLSDLDSYQLITQIGDTSSEYITKLQAEFDERTEWAQNLDNELKQLRPAVFDYQNQLTVKEKEADALLTRINDTEKKTEALHSLLEEKEEENNAIRNQLLEKEEENNEFRTQLFEMELETNARLEKLQYESIKIPKFLRPIKWCYRIIRPFLHRYLPQEFLFRRGLVIASSSTENVNRMIDHLRQRFPYVAFTVLVDEARQNDIVCQSSKFSIQPFKVRMSLKEKYSLVIPMIKRGYDLGVLFFGGERDLNSLKFVGFMSGSRYLMAVNEHLGSFYIMLGQAGSLRRHIAWRSAQGRTNPQDSSKPGLLNFLLTILGYIIVFFRVIPLLIRGARMKSHPNPFKEEDHS